MYYVPLKKKKLTMYYVIRVSMGDGRKINRVSMGDVLKLGAGRLSNVMNAFCHTEMVVFLSELRMSENNQHLLTNCMLAHQF